MTTYRVENGDCLELMKGLPDQSIDAVVTDPPYGVDFRGADWDAFIPNWIAEARRVAKVVIFTTGVTTLWEYPKPDWVCCWYREASNSRSKLGGFSHWSPVVVYGECKFSIDSIKLHAIQHAYHKGFPHPSPKPIALMEWMATNACPEYGTVLDPFTGSGSTGVAAVMNNRNFIGFELDPDYCTIARRRIAEAVPLWSPAPTPAPIQGEMFA